MRLAESAIFAQFQLVRVLFLILRRAIVSLFAFATGERYYLSHVSAMPPLPSGTENLS